jgi:hypothetical protein
MTTGIKRQIESFRRIPKNLPLVMKLRKKFSCRTASIQNEHLRSSPRGQGPLPSFDALARVGGMTMPHSQIKGAAGEW